MEQQIFSAKGLPIHLGLESLDSRVIFPGGDGFDAVFASDPDPLSRLYVFLAQLEDFGRLIPAGFHKVDHVVNHQLLFFPGGREDVEAEYEVFTNRDLIWFQFDILYDDLGFGGKPQQV